MFFNQDQQWQIGPVRPRDYFGPKTLAECEAFNADRQARAAEHARLIGELEAIPAAVGSSAGSVAEAIARVQKFREDMLAHFVAELEMLARKEAIAAMGEADYSDALEALEGEAAGGRAVIEEKLRKAGLDGVVAPSSAPLGKVLRQIARLKVSKAEAVNDPIVTGEDRNAHSRVRARIAKLVKERLPSEVWPCSQA